MRNGGGTRARRREYPLIFIENCNYGFRRNMLGLRRSGLPLASTTSVMAPVAIALELAGQLHLPIGLSGLAAFVAAAAILGWWRVVTPEWVKPIAQAYANQLIEAAETLADRPPEPSPNV
jgi:hypothetical protein